MSFQLIERKNTLKTLAAELERKTQQLVQESGASITEKSRENIRTMGAVDTGELLRSQETASSGDQVEARSRAGHSAPVNFGHVTASGSHVAARPFFSQAVDEVRAEMPRKAKEVFNKGIGGAGGAR